MMDLLRRYQKVLYIIITAVIVISFSFFGTFNTIEQNKGEDPIAFHAVDGSKVYRSELQDLISFISSDMQDKGSREDWGSGNAFNDGVLVKDFLQTGLAEVIIGPFWSQLKEELNVKIEKEKKFTPYVHPKAKFLSAERIWAYFSPDLQKAYQDFKASLTPVSQENFYQRIRLYLAERQFPPAYLRQVLRYQESQYEWIDPDEGLLQVDLSLFGHHSLQDWFGSSFLDLVAQFIINSSKMAEKKGITVSHEEALSSMMHNVQTSYKENQKHFQVAQSQLPGYITDQLKRLNMDQSKVMRIWKQILLCRKLIQESAEAILVDTSCYTDFYRYMAQYVEADGYQLPSELRLAHLKDLHRLELYLQAVSRNHSNYKEEYDVKELPSQMLALEEIKKVYPELVERRFKVTFSAVDIEALKAQINVRSMWHWQMEEKNWKELGEHFPLLARSLALTSEERFAQLDALDSNTRFEIDQYSRSKMIQHNPEAISHALNLAPTQEVSIGVRSKGGTLPLKGMENREELSMRLLQSPLNEQQDALNCYSQDGRHYYRIMVIERDILEHVLPYREALADGTMDLLLDQVLGAAYPKIRTAKPSLYISENGEWKPFEQVKEIVADAYFHNVYVALDRLLEQEGSMLSAEKDQALLSQMRCRMRLMPYVRFVQKAIMENPSEEEKWCRIEGMVMPEEMKETSALSSQWMLDKIRIREQRAAENSQIDLQVAFALNPGQWAQPQSRTNGNIGFFKILDKGQDPFDVEVSEKMRQAHTLLRQEAVKELARTLLMHMRSSLSLNPSDQSKE